MEHHEGRLDDDLDKIDWRKAHFKKRTRDIEDVIEYAKDVFKYFDWKQDIYAS